MPLTFINIFLIVMLVIFCVMKIINKQISVGEFKEMADKMFGDLVKAVVDIKKEIMAVNAELHADEEAYLIENGSEQKNLWGINFYPEFFGSDDFIEFDSMINLRPSQNNRSRSVESPEIRKKIIKIAAKLVVK